MPIVLAAAVDQCGGACAVRAYAAYLTVAVLGVKLYLIDLFIALTWLGWLSCAWASGAAPPLHGKTAGPIGLFIPIQNRTEIKTDSRDEGKVHTDGRYGRRAKTPP